MTKRKAPKDFKPTGRPTMYKPEYCEQMLEYFDVDPYREVTRINKKTGNEYTERIANRLPSFVGFASMIGVSRMTIQNWGKKYPDFLYAVTCAKACAEDILVTNTLLGLYNPQFSIFVAKNYTDMRDVTGVEHMVTDTYSRTPAEVQQSIRDLDKELALLEAQL